MEDEFINCRLAAKITLVQCERRQIKMRRFDTSGTVDAHFISCRTCEHWLTDEQYVEGRKALKSSNSWFWAGITVIDKRKKGGSGKCRKS